MKTCPKCKSNMIIDIVYGYPSEEMSDEADSYKIALEDAKKEQDWIDSDLEKRKGEVI